MICLGFELLVANWFSAYLTLFIKCTGYILFNVDSREWTGNGRKSDETKNPVRNCRRPGRVSDFGTSQIWSRDANYPTATSDTYHHHEQQQQRYSLRSSASAVTEARIFPFTINYVQIECGPFSLLPGGYWGSCPREKQPERENNHSPHLVSVRNEKLQLSICLYIRRARATTSPAEKQGRKSTFRLTTM